MAPYRKLFVYVATTVAQIISFGVLPDAYVPYASAVLAALGALGIYALPNAPEGVEPNVLGRDEVA